MTKLYQVSVASFDELDDYMSITIEKPTADIDKAMESYERWRYNLIENAREELADEYDEDEKTFDVFQHVNLDETDFSLKLNYRRNGSLQTHQCALHVWEL